MLHCGRLASLFPDCSVCACRYGEFGGENNGVWGCVWIALGSRKYSRSNDKFGLGLRRGIMRNNRSTYFLLCSLSRTISRLLCSHCLYRDTFVYIFVRKNDFVNSNECRKLELLRILWSREPDLCEPHRNVKCGIAFQP